MSVAQPAAVMAQMTPVPPVTLAGKPLTSTSAGSTAWVAPNRGAA